MTSAYIGIDPGKTGGIAVMWHDQITLLESCADTIRGQYDQLLRAKCCCTDHAGRSKTPQVIIEHVHTMPKQGIVSAGTFMQNYGVWLGLLTSYSFPYLQVSPHKWMKHFGTMPKEKKERKRHLLHLAQQRFPDTSISFALADAVMLAVYAHETSLTEKIGR